MGGSVGFRLAIAVLGVSSPVFNRLVLAFSIFVRRLVLELLGLTNELATGLHKGSQLGAGSHDIRKLLILLIFCLAVKFIRPCQLTSNVTELLTLRNETEIFINPALVCKNLALGFFLSEKPTRDVNELVSGG